MKRLLAFLLLGAVATAAPAPEFEARYLEGMQAATAWRYARARHLAEELLHEGRDNYAALYLLGRVYLYGEGSSPRAAYCFGRAHKLMDAAYAHPEELGEGKPGNAYYAILLDEANALSQVNRYEEACALIDRLDTLFSPSHLADKGFWLLKMGRADEARRLMLKLLDDPDQAHDRNTVLNTLGAIESETNHVDKAFGYFKQLAAKEESNAEAEPLAWHNAALAARWTLQFEAAEKLALEATRHFDQFSYSNPYTILAELYVQSGRLTEALGACKTMQAWRISQNAAISQHERAECAKVAALVLMQSGWDQEALSMLNELVEHPDRDSADSGQATLTEASSWYLQEYCLGLASERLEERLSYASWSETPSFWWQRMQLGRAARKARARIISLVASTTGGETGWKHELDGFLQPYGPGALGHPELSSQSWRVFGVGPVTESTRRLLDQENRPAYRAYLQAILGEAATQAGDTRMARGQLLAARALLPPAETKLRDRCLALVARIDLAQGDQASAVSSLTHLLQTDSSQIRACGLALPIDIQAETGPGAAQAAAMLARSPRCRPARGGFVLRLRGDRQISGELLARDGTRLFTLQPQPAASPEEAARRLCEVFHQGVFAPVLDLSQTDLRSIDGSTGVARAEEFKEARR